MRRLLGLVAGLICLSGLLPGQEPARAPALESLIPTEAERDARLVWWRDARFGMFVHWGASSHLGGTWQGKPYTGYAEHIQRMAKIPMPVYRREVVEKFNPTEFDAEEWIRLAKEAGMGYFIITAKHHDGFAMFDSQASTYNIAKATPYARDPMKDLAAACRRHGLKFGFYYSHAFDWGEEDAPGNDWDWQNPGGDKLLRGRDWWVRDPEFLVRARRYVDEKSIPQIRELIRQYDPDILWFDTPHKLPPEENLRILAAVRAAKPGLVVNGRLVRGAGDYDSTADRPAEFPPHDRDWEAIPTTNESYGYNQNDTSHKAPAHFIRLLAKASARGGNTLMNIGPMGNGRMDEKDVSILKEIGEWWWTCGESIRGTTRTPLPVQAWGESTRKGQVLYLHVFEWPKSRELVVGGLVSGVTDARLLGSEARLSVRRLNRTDWVIRGLPERAPSAADSVVMLDCAGTLETDPVRLLSMEVAVDTLRGFDGQLRGKLAFGPGKQGDAWVRNWKSPEDAVGWAVRVNAPATFDLEIDYDAPTDTDRNRVEPGGAGALPPGRGTGGMYTVQLGPHTFRGSVKTGLNRSDLLGRVVLAPGVYECRVAAGQITGEELFRLRGLRLAPVQPAGKRP
jgi:hypothetical protein